MEIKVCKKCGIEKQVSEFYKNRKHYSSQCKECLKQYRIENKERRKKYVEENKEK